MSAAKTGPRSAADAYGLFTGHLTAQMSERASLNGGTLSDLDRVNALEIARIRTEAQVGRPLFQDELDRFVANVPGKQSDSGLGTRLEAEYQACLAILGHNPAQVGITLAKVKQGLSALGEVLKNYPTAARQLEKVRAAMPSGEQLQALQEALARPNADSRTALLLFTQAFDARELMREWAGTIEGCPLGVHTRRVLDNLEQIMRERNLATCKVHPDVRLTMTLRLAAVLHDVGKAAALEAGDKNLQHEFTTPVLVEVAEKAGMRPREVALMRALVDNDAIGTTMNPNVARDPKEAARELSLLAKEVGMPLREFFKLQSAFYSADAYAYVFLHKPVFGEKPGPDLAPDGPRYQALRAAVEALDHSAA